jgi:hypothetical protein
VLVTSALLIVHQWTGYLVAVVLVATASMAFSRAKNAQAFTARPFRLAYALLMLQIVLGVVLYTIEGYWDAASPLIAYVHPAVAVGARGVGQVTLARARRTQMVVDANRLAGRGLVMTLLLVVVAIVLATVA